MNRMSKKDLAPLMTDNGCIRRRRGTMAMATGTALKKP